MAPLSDSRAARRALVEGINLYSDEVMAARGTTTGEFADRPVYPLFVFPKLRLETFYPYEEIHPAFARWSDQSITSLAEAGFFLEKAESSTIIDDTTTCYHCGAEISNWYEDDHPLNEHNHYFPNCDPNNTTKDLNKGKIKPLKLKADSESERRREIDTNIDSDNSATSSSY